MYTVGINNADILVIYEKYYAINDNIINKNQM